MCVTMKFALVLLATTMFLTSCRQAEVAHQLTTDAQERTRTNPSGTFPGHPPTEAEIQSYTPWKPTAEQVGADKAIVEHIIGTWTAAEDSNSAPYPVLIIRPDGTFRVNSNRRKLVCEGIWSVDRGVLHLKKRNAASGEYYGFHAIDHIDEHRLVCGVDISVAG